MDRSFVEPFAVQDIFVSDIADIEEVSPNLYRVAFYTASKCMHNGSRENMITVKLVMSGDTMERIGITPPSSGRAAVRFRLPVNS